MAWGQDSWNPTVVSQFGGIDQYHDSAAIKDEDAQDAENVLTDSGYLEKRPGNTRISTILDGFAVKSLAQFIGTSATKFLIAHSSDTVYRTDLSSSGVVSISTVSSGYNTDYVSALSKIIIVDGNSNPRSFDGSSTGSVANMPICQYVEFMHEAVWCANIPSVSSSRVAKSSVSSLTNWTVPANVAEVAGDPNTFDFQRDDGEGITCLKTTPWGLVVGKRHSMHILKGIDNLTFYKRIIDPSIGCIDDRSIQMVDGHLVWLAIDGVYSWAGSGPVELLSNDITPLIKQIRQLNSVAGAWIVDSEGEFELGTIDTNGPSNVWDTNSVSGSIFPTSTTFLDTSSANFSEGTTSVRVSSDTAGEVRLASHTFSDNFNDGNLTSGPTWVFTTNSMSVSDSKLKSPDSGTAEIRADSVVSSGSFKFKINHGGITDNKVYVKVISTATTFDSSGYAVVSTATASNVHLSIVEFPSETAICVVAAPSPAISPSVENQYEFTRSATGYMILTVAGQTICSNTDDTVAHSSQVIVRASGSNQFLDDFNFFGYRDDGYFVSRTFDTLFSTPIGGPVTFSSSVPGGITTMLFQVRSASSTSGVWSTWANIVNETGRSTQTLRYQQYLSSFTTTVSSVSPSLTEVSQDFISTGNYRSEVHSIGSRISQWKSGDWTDSVTPAGLLQYFVRSASYSFVGSEDLLTWSSMTNHNTIPISTNTYFQFRVQSSSMTSSSQTASISRFAANWQEGTEKPVASGTLDHRYFLCVTLSSTSTINDTCLVLQKNNKWVKYTGPSLAAMTIFDNNIVAGSGNTDSYVWKIMQPNVYRDDNSAIASFWTSKDFTGSNPFHEKVYHEVWIDAEVATSSVTIGVAANKGNSYKERTLSLDVTGDYINKRLAPNTGYVQGKYHKLKFSNSTIDQYFRINRFMFWSETKGRTQD